MACRQEPYKVYHFCQFLLNKQLELTCGASVCKFSVEKEMCYESGLSRTAKYKALGFAKRSAQIVKK